MKTRYRITSVFFVVALLAGCKREPSHAPATTSQQDLVAAAKEIVSNPNNWKANSSLLTDFTDAADKLNWEDKAEVKEFTTNAEELITFGTTWIDRLDEEESRKLANGVTHIVAELDSNVPNAQGGAQGQIDQNHIEQNAASAIGSSTTKLTPDQAEQFGKVFSKAVDSYEKIHKLGMTE